jgi:hypothetical protein
MKRFLAVTAAAVSATGMIFAAVPAATAATGPQIKTSTDTFYLKLTGTGFEKGWYLNTDYHSVVIMSPRLTFYLDIVNASAPAPGQGTRSTTQWYFVGDRNYIKYDGAPDWKISTPTPSDIRTYEKTSNVRAVIAKLFALPGLYRAGVRHYRTTDTVAQISAFLSYSYGSEIPGLLNVNDFTSISVSFSTNSDGWPVSLVIAGRSSDMILNISDTFTYNRPTTIKAP